MNVRHLQQYIYLMRWHKPIGIFLLLWPTLWALWLASDNQPNGIIAIIFVLGVLIMRSAGCVINDFADRHVDAHVARTRDRPLAAGKVSVIEAFVLLAILLCVALILVMQLNGLTIRLAWIGVVLTMIYPFMKRFTHLPQLGLGVAFAWGVPMAFAAQLNDVPLKAAWVFFAAALWPVIYDTMYAMVDKPDDIKIGIKSTAILFGRKIRMILAGLQLLFLSLLLRIGYLFQLSNYYFLSLIIVLILCGYQQWLIRNDDGNDCFKAFLNNNWIGLTIFIGILL